MNASSDGMQDRARGLLITLVGVLAVVPDALFVRLIDAEPLVIAFWRNLISGSVIGVGLLLLKGRAPFRAVLGSGFPALAYMAGAGLSAVFFVLAISLTGVANVVFIIATMPVAAAVWSRLVLGEPFTGRMIATTLAVGAGLALIALEARGAGPSDWRGNLLAAGVVIAFSGGLTAARRVRAVSMVPGVAIAYVGAATLLWPFIDPLAVPAGQWPLVALHGLFIVVSATGLALGPRYITTPEVALLILLETALAPVLVWMVIGEEPGRLVLLGGIVIILALAVSNLVALRRGLRNRRSHPAGRVP